MASSLFSTRLILKRNLVIQYFTTFVLFTTPTNACAAQSAAPPFLIPSIFETTESTTETTTPSITRTALTTAKTERPQGKAKVFARSQDAWIMHIECQPPASWTYCEPGCGSGDQAIDYDNARENAVEDFEQAILACYQEYGLIRPRTIEVRYTPESIGVEGESPRTLRYRKRQNPLELAKFETKVDVILTPSIPQSLQKKVSASVLHYLASTYTAKFRKFIASNFA